MRVTKNGGDVTVYLHSEREKRDVKHLIKMLELKECYAIYYMLGYEGGYTK